MPLSEPDADDVQVRCVVCGGGVGHDGRGVGCAYVFVRSRYFRGKPGVIVTGTSTGVGMDAIVRPMMKLAGADSYTQGTASILVDEADDFTWQRRTSKKVYVYVRTEDGTARSNRVVIR